MKLYTYGLLRNSFRPSQQIRTPADVLAAAPRSDAQCSSPYSADAEGADADEYPVGQRDQRHQRVAALKARLPLNARVGTVNKFQGQEAPIVFYSMTTSTPDDAPRGMEFLYSLNRLNVAVSRARCVAVIVASPALFQVRCRTTHQIELANALCRYVEMARSI